MRSFAEDGWAVVLIADNGAGSARAVELGDTARAILEPWGATIDAASAEGQGTSFELRLVTTPG
ncbi:MAG: sensor histidine kinase [Myxococcales bacterium]|nr:sensor histidine kinase [Myxococcales bacterium]